MEWVWVPKIRKLFLFNCLWILYWCSGFIFPWCNNIRSVDVIVWKFVDLFVTARIGHW